MSEQSHEPHDELLPRLRAIADLMPASLREGAGMHEYDGRAADLSPDGVSAALARLGGEPLDDPYDEAHLTAFENGLRHELGELETHRTNPLHHVGEMDLSSYERAYAPEAERFAARIEHLRLWPTLADNAVAALDRLSAPVARSLLGPVRGLADLPDGLPEDARRDALAAHARLLTHVEHAAEHGPESASLGAEALSRLMGVGEAMEVDLDSLASRADAERDRLRAGLAEATARLAPGRDPMEFSRELTGQHPDAEGVLDAARTWTRICLDFTEERQLAPFNDGECRIDVPPPALRWGTAMMAWSGPWETDNPSFYYVTPPDPELSEREAAEWLEQFSHTTLPAVSVHEVAPGHFSHGRALRRAPSQVRRALHSMTFAEGWAHYAEEMCLEEGFGAYAAERLGDPGWTADHYEIGVWLEALIRVTRLSVAIGMHTGTMTVEQAAARFSQDTPLQGPAALSEAGRATFDPTYGRYTWGKLEIMALRERAREQWGSGFSLPRFHRALLQLGSPPLGLIGAALDG
ncbi:MULTISPECIES: DUF885 family protein [unclassified Nocardiopsis]|uniref:DUF885 family protein n=1 Tax=unclassified Nocardiopsis TaxID=2649073 RepID=UPI00066A2915|nr:MULTISPECIES: DUF885 family protein [unclassified Nocardiopsis]MBQ1082692.1 DUF885 family protein [Nocardiopsis sp. B62]